MSGIGKASPPGDESCTAAAASDVLGGRAELGVATNPLPLGDELGMAPEANVFLGGEVELDVPTNPLPLGDALGTALEEIVDMEFCRLAGELRDVLTTASLFVTSEPAVSLGIQSCREAFSMMLLTPSRTKMT